MIVSKIQGGIGNQMFIYATAYALSKRLNEKLVLDHRSGYRKDIYNRTFLLDNYKIDATYVHPLLKSEALGLDFLRSFAKKTRSILPDSLINFITDERFETHEKGYLKYLDGYFQNYRVFDEYITDLRKAFELQEAPPYAVEQLKNRITNEDSVCIHFRSYEEVTGDHRSDNMMLQNEYYNLAIDQISHINPNATLFIFSDKIDKAKVLFNKVSLKKIYVEETRDLQLGMLYDLYLMTHCKDFIIANSTFSWWGAYLANREEKKVFRPSGTYYMVSDELFHDDWIAV